MLFPKNAMKISLDLKVVFLALIFPISGLCAGYAYSMIENLGRNLWQTMLIGVVIGLILNFICYYPKLFRIFFYVLPIPVVLMIITNEISLYFVNYPISLWYAAGGLGLGFLIDWVLVFNNPFYNLSRGPLIIIYLFFSVVIVGLFMGIPLANILLGIIVGNYWSLRYYDAIVSKRKLNRSFLISGFFTAFVFALIMAISGFLLLHDSSNIIVNFHQYLHFKISYNQLRVMVYVGGILLIFLQFWLTYITAKVMYEFRHKSLLQLLKEQSAE